MMPSRLSRPMRRLQADDAVGRGRTAHRPAGVGADAEHRVAGGDGGAGAARGARGRAREVVRVERLAAERAERRGGRELRQVHLGQDDGARVPQLLHDERIVGRDRALEEHRPAGGRHVGGVDVVLEHDRDAVQRRARALGLPLGVERAGRLERLRVERHHRVNRWALAVVRLDAGQEALHQLLRGQGAGGEGRVQVGDGRLIERRATRAAWVVAPAAPQAR